MDMSRWPQKVETVTPFGLRVMKGAALVALALAVAVLLLKIKWMWF